MAGTGKWQDRLELAVGLSVVVSLLVLVAEVRTNTRAIERQSRMEYVEAMTQPFVDDVSLGDVLAKIKAVDGREPHVSVLMEGYELTETEAAAWSRYLHRMWFGMEVDFWYGGPEMVEERIRRLLPYPDAELYWATARPFHSREFQALVDEIQAAGPVPP